MWLIKDPMRTVGYVPRLACFAIVVLLVALVPAARVRGAGVVGDGTPGSCTDAALARPRWPAVDW